MALSSPTIRVFRQSLREVAFIARNNINLTDRIDLKQALCLCTWILEAEVCLYIQKSKNPSCFGERSAVR